MAPQIKLHTTVRSGVAHGTGYLRLEPIRARVGAFAVPRPSTTSCTFRGLKTTRNPRHGRADARGRLLVLSSVFSLHTEPSCACAAPSTYKSARLTKSPSFVTCL